MTPRGASRKASAAREALRQCLATLPADRLRALSGTTILFVHKSSGNLYREVKATGTAVGGGFVLGFHAGERPAALANVAAGHLACVVSVNGEHSPFVLAPEDLRGAS